MPSHKKSVHKRSKHVKRHHKKSAHKSRVKKSSRYAMAPAFEMKKRSKSKSKSKKVKRSKSGRKLSKYNLHIRSYIRAHPMKGKSKAERKKIFKDAAKAWNKKSKQ